MFQGYLFDPHFLQFNPLSFNDYDRLLISRGKQKLSSWSMLPVLIVLRRLVRHEPPYITASIFTRRRAMPSDCSRWRYTALLSAGAIALNLIQKTRWTYGAEMTLVF